MQKKLPLNPGSMLGMMGGGQLGRMFAMEAAYMGYHVTVLEPGQGSPAAEVSLKHIAQPYLSEEGLKLLAQTSEAVSTEFENVPAQALNTLAQSCFVAPPGSAVAVAQDRNVEKHFIETVAHVPVAPNAAILKAEDIESVSEELFPAILKTARLGYDGKGQVLVDNRDELRHAFAELKEVDCILEKRLQLHREVSVIVARGHDGQTATFPVCENLHRSGILAVTVMPARVDDETSKKARQYATQIVDALGYIGVLCVEFFVLKNGDVVANEMAPRPHNSGHATIDACWSNQYEQQLRCMTGLPLADTTQHSPAVMLNLLGDIWYEGETMREPAWDKVLAIPGAKLHLYGKAQARRARKMGHVTCLGRTMEEALACAKQVANVLGFAGANVMQMPVDERAIRAAVDVLECSGLVAMPTETVYGLAANADDEKAVKKIFAAKNRPATHPLIVHITGEDALDHWAVDIPQSAYDLARKFWPGPLTMILKKADHVGNWVTGDQDSVGLRAPSHPWARALITAFAGKHHRGIAAPSANTFGRISPTTAQHVRDDLGEKPRGKVDLILDGGECDVGVESTIINLSGEQPEILRHGAITRSMLEEVLGCAVPDGSKNSPRASGTLKSHYAPKTKVILVDDIKVAFESYADKKLAVMAPQNQLSVTPKNVIKWFAAPAEAADYARVLYARLHELDAVGADFILIENPAQGGLWDAVHDRLGRAAA